MASVIEEIKSRLNIVDVASGYIKLEKAGGNFKARCPFHNEKTPSFLISPSRQTYHCFGCNRGGDVLSFVEEIEGLDFSGALKILAERAGVELKREKREAPEVKHEHEMLYRALELAAKFYEAVLPKFPDVEAYLKGRGLTEDTIKEFRVGYAPDEWRSLGEFLVKKGISLDIAVRAGLVVRSEKGFYDRFRGRVMFPIADNSGRIVAFSGRVLSDNPGKTLGVTAQAKYVNSPETDVFHKSRILFGFFNAKESMRREDRAVLVEGQMDLVMSHQAGVKNTVASSGTALTAEHLGLIKRFTQNIVLAFDADDAGLAAAHKGVMLAIGQDMSVRIAKIPQGMDPADVALNNPDLWRTAISTAKPVIDFYLELLPERYQDGDTLRAKVIEIVIPFIAEQKSAIDQGHYVGLVAKLLGIKEEPVWEEVKKSKALIGIERSTEKIIASLTPHSRLARIVRSIEGLLLWQEGLKEDRVVDPRAHRGKFQSLLERIPRAGSPEEDREALIFEAEARFHGNPHIAKELEELIKNLEEEIIRHQFTQKMEELKDAEMRGEVEKAQALLLECQALSKELHTLTTKQLS